LSHPAVFTSNVQCARLAAGRRTQAGDATDRAVDVTHIVKFGDALPWAVQNGWTDRNAVWDAESYMGQWNSVGCYKMVNCAKRVEQR